MKKQEMTRRSFIGLSAAAGATVLGRGVARASVAGANDTIRVGVLGVRGKGGQHVKLFNAEPGVEVVALCDPDTQFLAQRRAELESEGRSADLYTDMRRVFDRDDIDAVVIATPNHWHALAGIWACQAGKDVYVEKPVSHNIWEGRQLVDAAGKYNRVVQTGTQRRSDTGLQEAFAWLQSGALGKIRLARAICYRDRPGIGKVDRPRPIPPHIDYNLWTGPAPLVPLRRKNLHYDWHWVWDTGNGEIGNQGIHELDLARWAAGHDGLPRRVLMAGGRYGYDDDGQTPNTALAWFDYDTIPLLIEVRALPTAHGVNALPQYRGLRVGNVIHCEDGYLAGAWAYDLDGNRIRSFAFDGGQNHVANFIAAVRERKPEHLNAPILEGHISSALPHLANASYRLGRQEQARAVASQLADCRETEEAFNRMCEHLDKNGVDLRTEGVRLGALVQLDPTTERFHGRHGRHANELLRRNYREPFVVPETV